MKNTKSYKVYLWVDSLPAKVKKFVSTLLFCRYLRKHRKGAIYNSLMVPDCCFKSGRKSHKKTTSRLITTSSNKIITTKQGSNIKIY